MDFKPVVERMKAALAEKEAADAAAAEAKKAEPYERLWNTPPVAGATEPPPQAAAAPGSASQNRSYTPPPMLQDLDSGTAWWKPPELKGLISSNIRGY